MITTGSDTRGVALTVILPVLNEAENLQAALESVAWAEEVFVVDSGSTDATAQIANDLGATVIQFSYHGSGPKKKAWALAALPISHEWALFLDADERVTPELRAEIAHVLKAPSVDGYYVDREMFFRGKLLRSYRPDWNLRLLRHRCAKVEDLGMGALSGTGDNEIHEHFLVSGQTAFLAHPLLHDDYRGIGPWIDRHNKYATWEAHLNSRLRGEPVQLRLSTIRDPVARNRVMRRVWVRLPARPLLRFLLWYVGKRAVKDGWNGFLYSVLMGWYELVIGLKTAEIQPGHVLADPVTNQPLVGADAIAARPARTGPT